MADFQAIAKKYGADSNWNALRGVSDPLFEGLDPNANWNSFRPQSASPQPSAPSPARPSAPSPTQPSQFPDHFPPGYQFPYHTMGGDQRSTTIYPSVSPEPRPDLFGIGTKDPSQVGNRSYEDYLAELLRSGVGDQEARETTDYLFGRGQAPAGATTTNSFANPGGGDIDAIIRQGFQASQGRAPSDADFQYWRGVWPSLVARGQELGDPDYAWKRLIGMGAGPQDAARYGPWAGGDPNAERIGGGDGGGGAMPTGFAQSAAYNPFDDPATKPFIDLLNQRIADLQQPYHSDQLDQLNSYLQQYFQTLQGPTYTPAQMDLMQTQSLDPLETQRGAARQQVLQRLSARGIAPSSGIAEQALADVDKQFNALRTQTQAGFAEKAIDLNRINQQQAAGVAQALANIDQTQFQNQENRANQAVQYAQIIPDLARQRLQDAVQVMSGQNVNPTSLIGPALQAGQFQDAQSQAMMMGLFQLLPQLLNVDWRRLFGG